MKGTPTGTQQWDIENASSSSRQKGVLILNGESEQEAKAASQQTIIIPEIPTFPSFAAHRAHLLRQLTLGFRLFSKYGFDEGVSGHMTGRDPEFPNLFWVNPFGVHFGQISPSNLILANHNGDIIRGNKIVNRSAFAIHSAIHAIRPDAIAACHTHSMYGKTFSALGRKILPITQDSCAFYEDLGLYTEYGGVAVEPEEGKRIAQALGPHKAAVLQNHGLLTVGQTVDEAVWWFISLERCCQSQLIAEAAVKSLDCLKLIDHELARDTRQIVGNAKVGWFNSQPMFSMLLEEMSRTGAKL